MILDKQTTFSELQAVTATALSTNTLRLPTAGTVPREGGPIVRNLGAGNEIPMLIQIGETFVGLTTLTVTIETSNNEDMTSSTVLYTSGAIPVATLRSGYRLPIRWLPDAPLQTYLALRYTVGGTPATAGRISAALATEVNT